MTKDRLDPARDVVAAYEQVMAGLRARPLAVRMEPGLPREPSGHRSSSAQTAGAGPWSIAGAGARQDRGQELQGLVGDAVNLVRGVAGFGWRLAQELVGGLGQAAVSDVAPSLALPSVSPGSSSTGDVVLRNPTLDTLDDLRLGCDGLVARGGSRIDGAHVTFTPNVVELQPASSTRVTVSVAVPGAAMRSRYLGLLTVAGQPSTQLLVTLDVV